MPNTNYFKLNRCHFNEDKVVLYCVRQQEGRGRNWELGSSKDVVLLDFFNDATLNFNFIIFSLRKFLGIPLEFVTLPFKPLFCWQTRDLAGSFTSVSEVQPCFCYWGVLYSTNIYFLHML